PIRQAANRARQYQLALVGHRPFIIARRPRDHDPPISVSAWASWAAPRPHSAGARPSGRGEARDLAATQQETAETEVFEVGDAVGGDRLAVRRLLARALHVAEESVAVH